MCLLPFSNISCWSNYRIFVPKGPMIKERFLGSVLEFTNDQTCQEVKAHILGGKKLSVTLGMSAQAGKMLFRHAMEGA